MINDKANDIIEERFQSFLSRCRIWLKTSMKGSDFIFDSVHLLYYRYNETNLKRLCHT